jgi:1-acyl-sn-glycerol-3-phosphate acyltransferase
MHREVREVIEVLQGQEALMGYDPFGFRPDVLPAVLPFIHFLYRVWFRVQVHGMENIPEGRVLLIANHSGQLPYDGAMIGASLVFDLAPPRIVRSMVERWVPTLPFVSTFMARCGQVVGTPDNARRLLANEQPLVVFPEGSRGISKPFRQRYQLEEFGLGFLRLAMETQTPIVPIAVVGAEEQLPQLYNFKKLARMLGMPALPLIPNLVIPAPVKYRIYFGEPLLFDGDADDEDRVIRGHVEEVRAQIRAMIARGLAERTSLCT